MGDEDRRHLPQRVRGAARDGSGPPAAPVLSEEMRQRIQAAVRAERAGTTGEDQKSAAEPPRRGIAAESAGGTASHGGERIARANSHQKRHGKPEHAAKSGHAGKPEPNAKAEPVVEREHSVKDGPAGKAEPVQAEPVQAEPVPTEEDARTGPGRRRAGWIRAAAFFLVLIAVGSLATAVSRHLANASSGTHAVPLQRQEALTRLQAASWVARQVDPADVVSCDQSMCAALRADRFPANKLLLLGPISQPPVTSAVVVVTAAVRSMFGSSLGSAWAPAVLASFGSGPAQITIRVMSSHGAGAYQAALSAGQGGRIAYGQVLLTPQIVLSPTAESQLATGQVDERVVAAIAYLASQEPVDILEFGNVGPDASPYLPLRCADLAVTDSAVNQASPAYLRAVQARLSAVSTEFRPASSQTVQIPNGPDVFRVEFAAPSPLGSIGTPTSP
jgi:hypothetical protein